MSDQIDPEGFYRFSDPLCVCGPLYTYAGHIEPGGYAEDCPLHGNPKLFYDEMQRLRAGIEGIKAKALDRRQIITEGPFVGRLLVSHWCDEALLNADACLLADGREEQS